MSDFKGIHQDRLKLHFLRPGGKISRRELLKLVLPKYEIVPFIESELCRGSQKCGLCRDTCPLGAIKFETNKVIVDTTICRGCGACIAACPHMAIIYPTFSLGELDKEMKRLLLSEGTLLEPRIIAATCQSCLIKPDENRVNQLTYPGNALPLKIPCLATVSPWLILRAFDRGAQGFALISGRGKCHSGFDITQWQKNIRFAQTLLSCWDIESGRIRVFEIREDEPGNLEQELTKFAEEIARLDPTPLRLSEPTPPPAEGLLPLPALIKGLANKLGNPPGGIVSAGITPLGKVELDGSQCTGCGLCALNCPTEALTISSSEEETGAYQLLFRHGSCVACDRCVDACPEKCVRVEHVLELDRIDSPAVVLFEDRIAKCRQCGSPIAPKAMIDKLQAKLLAARETSQFELCLTCKIRVQFNTERTTRKQEATPVSPGM